MSEFAQSDVSWLQGRKLLLLRAANAIGWTIFLVWEFGEFHFYAHHLEETFVVLTGWAAIAECVYLWFLTWYTAKAMIRPEGGRHDNIGTSPSGHRRPSFPGVFGVCQRVVCVFTVVVTALYYLLLAIGGLSPEAPEGSPPCADWILHGLNLIPMLLETFVRKPTFYVSDALCILCVALAHLTSTIVYSILLEETVYGLSWKHDTRACVVLFGQAIIFEQIVFLYMFLLGSTRQDICAKQDFKSVIGFLKVLLIFSTVMFPLYYFNWAGGHTYGKPEVGQQLDGWNTPVE